MNTTWKRSKTVKPFDATFTGISFTVPAGSTVSNMTALGPDDAYHFWEDFSEVAEKVTGFKDSMLRHDLDKYGLNIPDEYCEPYTF